MEFLIFRFIIDDGTAEGHLYATGSLVPTMLRASSSEWASLLARVKRVGRVVYNWSSRDLKVGAEGRDQ